MGDRERREGPNQARLVLDRFQAADRTDHEGVRGEIQLASHGRAVTRGKPLDVDAISDLDDLALGNAHAAGQPAMQVVGHDHEAVDQSTAGAPDAPLPPVAPLGIIAVVAVLAVNDGRNARESSGQHRIHRAPIPGMHDVGAELAEQPREPHECPNVVPRSLAQLEDFDPPTQATSQRADPLQTDDGVPDPRRFVVHDVDEAVLQASDVERVNHVGHAHVPAHGWPRCRHRCRHAVTTVPAALAAGGWPARTMTPTRARRSRTTRTRSRGSPGTASPR